MLVPLWCVLDLLQGFRRGMLQHIFRKSTKSQEGKPGMHRLSWRGHKLCVFVPAHDVTLARTEVQVISAECSPSDASGCYDRNPLWQSHPGRPIYGAQPCKCQKKWWACSRSHCLPDVLPSGLETVNSSTKNCCLVIAGDPALISSDNPPLKIRVSLKQKLMFAPCTKFRGIRGIAEHTV